MSRIRYCGHDPALCPLLATGRQLKPCCEELMAAVQLESWRRSVIKSCALVELAGGPVRRGRKHGWCRWLRWAPDVPGALFAAHRHGRRKR